MIAILKFKLPEEREEFELAQNGVGYSIVLEELDNWLRTKTKYENQETVTVNEVRTKLRELLEDRVPGAIL
jgi:hypothetical protein